MLIGSASTVTIVSVKRLSAGLLVELRGNLLLQQLDALLQFRQVADHEGEFLGRLAQVFQALGGNPGRRQPQQAKQRPGVRREQPLQAHEHAAQFSQVGTFVFQAAGEQPRPRPGRPGPSASRTMRTSTSPWSCSRWFRNATDEANRQPSLTACRSRSIERSGRSRTLSAMRGPTCSHSVSISEGSKANSKATSLDHRDEGVARVLDAGRARAFVERLEELRHHRQVLTDPGLGRGVGEVEVQPHEAGFAARQPGHRGIQADRLAGRVSGETVAADQPVFVGAVSRLQSEN